MKWPSRRNWIETGASAAILAIGVGVMVLVFKLLQPHLGAR